MSDSNEQRGMLSVSTDDDGMVQMEHQFTDESLEFDRSDLDEVIEVLMEFRAALENDEVN